MILLREKQCENFWDDDKRIKIFRSEFFSNSLFLLKWLTLAYLLEALMIIYIPAQLVGSVVGGEGLFSIVAGAFIGVPAYLNLCSSCACVQIA